MHTAEPSVAAKESLDSKPKLLGDQTGETEVVESTAASGKAPDKPKETLYCICQSSDCDDRFMIQCDGCTDWFHGECLDPPMVEDDTKYLHKFYCPNCEPKLGKSIYKEPTRKSKREKNQINYNELNQGSFGVAVDERRFTKMLEARTFAPNNFQRLRGEEVTLEWARKTGFRAPVIIETPEGLDMVMPANTLTVDQVADLCGRGREVDVIEVATQSERMMTLGEWAHYFGLPREKRKRILNVISLEISDTDLAKQVRRPKLVRDLDWIDTVWPADVKTKEYPRVQLYCLMSVEDSYTDFHIDFGGSSVFYHLLSGEKIFYFIEPTKTNLKKYEKWSSSPDQSHTFLGDEIKGGCIEVRLTAGNTMMIPTGWIHAVYTPKDSVVIGGNFVQGLNIPGQLDIYEIEKRTMVPAKFRFPYFEKMQWYAAKTYLAILRDKPESLSKWELDGLLVLHDFLNAWAIRMTDISGVKKEERKAIKRMVPQGIKNVQKLLRKLNKHVNAAMARLTPIRVRVHIGKPGEGLSHGNGRQEAGVENVSKEETAAVPTETGHSELPTTEAPSQTPHTNGSNSALEVSADVVASNPTQNVNIPVDMQNDDDSDDWLSDLTEMEFLDSEDETDDFETEDDDDGFDMEDSSEDAQAYLPREAGTKKRKRRSESAGPKGDGINVSNGERKGQRQRNGSAKNGEKKSSVGDGHPEGSKTGKRVKREKPLKGEKSAKGEKAASGEKAEEKGKEVKRKSGKSKAMKANAPVPPKESIGERDSQTPQPIPPSAPHLPHGMPPATPATPQTAYSPFPLYASYHPQLPPESFAHVQSMAPYPSATVPQCEAQAVGPLPPMGSFPPMGPFPPMLIPRTPSSTVEEPAMPPTPVLPQPPVMSQPTVMSHPSVVSHPPLVSHPPVMAQPSAMAPPPSGSDPYLAPPPLPPPSDLVKFFDSAATSDYDIIGSSAGRAGGSGSGASAVGNGRAVSGGITKSASKPAASKTKSKKPASVIDRLNKHMSKMSKKR
ncbi:JmjC domain-containing histone demethylation protein 1 [Borealophlyctis nickersoniae]|nr:JmjC domain-containing histone demethylation protein 1 [Borealophlyctis nickersoniae]